MKFFLFAGLSLVVLGSSSACGPRHHLTRSHGESVRAMFDKQVLHPQAGKQERADLGLDSQEAAIVANNYRESLESDEAATSQEEPVLLLAPSDPRARRPARLPPSVPPSDR